MPAAEATPPARPCAPGATVDPTSMSRAVPGSFSAPGVDELLGEVPCPSAAGNVTLVRRIGDRWQIARLADVDGRRQRSLCRPMRLADGRDLLVCREVLHVGAIRRESIVAFDYARQESGEREELFAVTDTTGAACSGAREVAVVRLEDFVLVDVDGDGDLDVRAAIHARRARVPPHASCDEQRTGTGRVPTFAEAPGRTLELALEGARLIPTAATARLLAKLEVELPTP